MENPKLTKKQIEKILNSEYNDWIKNILRFWAGENRLQYECYLIFENNNLKIISDQKLLWNIKITKFNKINLIYKLENIILQLQNFRDAHPLYEYDSDSDSMVVKDDGSSESSY